jgi:hypothetical protein
MAITGNLFQVTNPTSFFFSLLQSGAPNPGSFAPLTGVPFLVHMVGIVGPGKTFVVEDFADIIHGTFTLDEFTAGENVGDITLSLIHNDETLYRSQEFTYARAKRGGLDIYLYQPNQRDLSQPDPVSVTAGAVSQALAGAVSSLPKNTTLTANPWGFGFAGTQQGANIQFGVSLVAETSPKLNVFLRLHLVNYHIFVGFPADCQKTAKDIFAEIQAKLVDEDSQVNAFVRSQLANQIKQQATLLPDADVNKLINKLLSVTFKSIVFPNPHAWALSNTNDSTTVMTLNPVVGFPQGW